LQEVEDRFGVGLGLFDIGDMRGVERSEFGTLDLFCDRFAGRRRRRRVLLAHND
jgi:hypothetical protein